MRKYRNGKQSREPRQLSKYSPEYLQYRGSRGGYSVKVGLCDITGDGDADTISVAWRNPANGKVENCTVIIPPVQIPASGPSSLSATESVPASGLWLQARAFQPASEAKAFQLVARLLAASESVPVNGPSGLSATENVPVSGPSGHLQPKQHQLVMNQVFQYQQAPNQPVMLICGYTFTMGSPTSETGRGTDKWSSYQRVLLG